MDIPVRRAFPALFQSPTVFPREPFWTQIHTHTHLTALCPGPPGWAGTRKVKPIWILLEQEWQWNQLEHMQVCTLLQTDNHASTHHSVFYRPDALPVAHPTVSMHWRLILNTNTHMLIRMPQRTNATWVWQTFPDHEKRRQNAVLCYYNNAISVLTQLPNI